MAARFALGGIEWWTPDGADPDRARAALERALAAVESGAAKNVKRGRRKELYPIFLDGPDEPSHLLKVNRYLGLGALRRRLLGSKARRELRLAQLAVRRGLPTPLPLAAGERRSALAVERCYLLIPFVRGARDLRKVAAGTKLAPAERRTLAREFGRFARRVHDAGLLQEDFQPNNFLLVPGGAERIQIIDFERAARRRRIGRRTRAWTLAKLERELPAASLTDRARFVLGYAGDDRGARRAAWRDVQRAMPRLARFDYKRLLRTLERDEEVLSPRILRAPHPSPNPELAASAPDDPEPWFMLRFAAKGPDDRLYAVASAQLLARRGLALPPLSSGWIIDIGWHLHYLGRLPRRLDALDARERSEVHAALTVLIRRLAAIGAHPELRPDLVGFAEPGAPFPLLVLAPHPLRLGAPWPQGREARALAARLLGLPER